MTPSSRELARTRTSRGAALQALLQCRAGQGFVQEHLNRVLTGSTLSGPDRRLATALVYGVLRRRATLDALLRPLCRQPGTSVNPVVWEALRLGAFQLLLMSQIPPHAAIYETVELVATWGKGQAKGFVNGVLRALSRLITAEHLEAPAANALPIENGRFRKLAQPVLPEPSRFPVEYLATGFALPEWLVERWLKRFGWEETLRLSFWFAGPAPLWLRCNPLRASREECLTALAAAGITALAGEHPQSLRLEEHRPVNDLPGFEQGWLTVQDASAMNVATALAPREGWSIFDMCAAPGGKTTHLAELMNNKGSITACDVDDGRLATVNSLCARLGITIVQTCRLHPEGGESVPTGPFDAALVDVPCSNTGVLGRRPEARWRLQPKDLKYLLPLQTSLLLQAVQRVKAGGTIVYSTCSIEPEENGQVAREALRVTPGLVLEAEHEAFPGRPADGGYWARLRKNS